MNELKRAAEFRAALAGYQMSAAALDILRRAHLALLVGPTASGRNTIITRLVQTGRYHYLVSDTTRAPRMNNGRMEQDGGQYWFKTEDEMLAGLRQGDYLEAAIIHNQQVSGMSVRELAAAEHEHRIAIRDVEVVGAELVHRAKPDVTVIFVTPPSFDEWMRRLHGRGQLPPAEVRRRLEGAAGELTAALQSPYYTFVVNGDLAAAVADVDTIIRNGTPGTAAARAAAVRLSADLRRFLEQA